MCVHHQPVFIFMLFLVDRGHTPPTLSFSCRLLTSTTTHLLVKGNSHFPILTHDGKDVDPGRRISHLQSSLALSHTPTVTYFESAWSRSFYSHRARTRFSIRFLFTRNADLS